MQMIPLLFAYLGVLIFLVAILVRIVYWVKMPMHLRWELYPVAHEGKKASYGGSYFEESEWWKKPRTFSLWGELKVMIPEILFLVALREHNRKMWYRSFPFHFGLYLIAGASVLMGINSLLVLPDETKSLLSGIVAVGGTVGLVLGIVGAGGLLKRRLSSEDLKDYTSPGDLFNLTFFVVTFGSSLVGLALSGPDFFADINRFIGKAITLQFGRFDLGFWPGMSVILMSSLLAYIPLTHMSHFVSKYFAYHAVRWNDRPNLGGGRMEAAIAELLIQPVSWAGPHIRRSGKKSWVDLVTESLEEDKQE